MSELGQPNPEKPDVSRLWALLGALFVIITLIFCGYLSHTLLNTAPTDFKTNVLVLSAILLVTLLCILGFLGQRAVQKSMTPEQQLKAQSHRLQQEKMASLGQMIAGVAHEINTPLSYLSGNMGIINRSMKAVKSDLLGPISSLRQQKKHSMASLLKSQAQMIAKVREERHEKKISQALELGADSEAGIKDIAELVATLKDFSRVDRQEDELADIHDLINTTLKVAKRQIDGHHIKVTRRYQIDLPEVFCNPSKINQVFLNLLVNACQAMRGGGELNIRTKVVRKGKFIKIDFIDDGTGMTRETRDSLFDPFYTTKEVGEGTGLGMSIVYAIVQEHKGDIQVHSELGAGTHISLLLPIEAPDTDIHKQHRDHIKVL